MFTVPIIPPDLRHEETIIQAAYALDCLQKTINTIFDRIDKRIEKNNNKVEELQERIQKSQQKINSLQGTRKAIQIYAPARFPASNIFKDIPVTFGGHKEKVEHQLGIMSVGQEYQVKSKLDPNLPHINEKLIFFHVREHKQKLVPETTLTKERLNIKQNQDLGNMPSDLRSIPSVLLFNTDYSVYDFDECDSEATSHSDAWKRAKFNKSKRQQYGNQQSIAKQILEPPPHSLAHRNEKLNPSGGLKYKPKLSEAPELDLPLDLPDLPGIADDLRYESQEAKQKIAPSGMVVENLPEITELELDNEKVSNIQTEVRESHISTSAIKRAAPPPPPPPPPVTLIVAQQAPPPPPPPPLLKNPSLTQKYDKSNSADTRSELMAAIRNAGGVGKAHLRHNAAAAPLSNPNKDDVDHTSTSKKLSNSLSQKSSVKSQGGGGDLMADLHNKLLMRRKGISGSKEITDNKIGNNTNSSIANAIPRGNPVISRLSSLIPPPSAKDTNRNAGTTSDEDSNDTDWVD